MTDAFLITDSAVDWLRANYEDFQFSTERDVVWTLQKRIAQTIKENRLQFQVLNDYPMMKGARRSFCADLAIVSSEGLVATALEVKYEPSHLRSDVRPAKLPVVSWKAVGKDVDRVRTFVEHGKAMSAKSYFIDEGGHFASREPPPETSWISWGGDRRVLQSILYRARATD